MSPTITFQSDESFALRLDREDPIASFRDRFCTLPGKIYMLANSLGLMPKSAGEAVNGAVDEWRRLAVEGWLNGNPPWFYMSERAGEAASTLVGASRGEVICTGTTTYNVHSLVSTFYRPEFGRTKIIASDLDFPTDIYALKSQISLRGLDWRDHLVLVGADRSGFVNEDEIVHAMTDDVAIVHLPSVFFRSGQLLDIERLTKAAHDRQIIIGFDCSHSVGVIPHRLSEWDVDFAMWCGYKYLCGGPGAPAFIFLNRRYFQCEPGLAGWFGYVKERQFEMNLEFEHSPNAGGWQVSSPGILGAASMTGALDVINEAGVQRLREKSLRMTSYLMYLADEFLRGEPYRFSVATPREPHRRGGHVALARSEETRRIKEALILRGTVVDHRPPDVIRVAPSPLYSTYHEIWTIVRQLREIVDSREYEKIPQEPKPIS